MAKSVATLMQEFMAEQAAFNKATAATLADLTGKAKAESGDTSKPKATGSKKRGKRKTAKRDLDVAQYQSQKFAPSSDKAVRKIKAWADAGNVGRLREYAGTGPRVSGEGDPRIAVTEGNRLLAANVIAACFSKSGKPNKANNATK